MNFTTRINNVLSHSLSLRGTPTCLYTPRLPLPFIAGDNYFVIRIFIWKDMCDSNLWTYTGKSNDHTSTKPSNDNDNWGCIRHPIFTVILQIRKLPNYNWKLFKCESDLRFLYKNRKIKNAKSPINFITVTGVA